MWRKPAPIKEIKNITYLGVSFVEMPGQSAHQYHNRLSYDVGFPRVPRGLETPLAVVHQLVRKVVTVATDGSFGGRHEGSEDVEVWV